MFAHYYDTGEHSDLTIICGSRTFKVHKIVLGAQSEYFRAACRTDAFKEGETGIINLQAHDSASTNAQDGCDDPSLVEMMLRLLYRNTYEDVETSCHTIACALENCDGNMIHHAKMFAIAVKYHIPPLKAFAAAKFTIAIRKHFAHNNFADALDVVFTTTPDEVRDLRDCRSQRSAGAQGDSLQLQDRASCERHH